MPNKKVVLVVAAHPDDEVLGCAGTVVRLKHEGWRAVLMLMTQGIAGRAKTGAAVGSKHIKHQKILAAETKKAAALVGYDRVVSQDFPDNRMDTVARADIAHTVAKIVAEEKPDLVITHHPTDYNWDHGITYDAVLMGARASPGEHSPNEIWCFEILSSTERGWRGKGSAFHPAVYVDIASTMDTKLKALEAYTTELHAAPHPRSLEGISNLARKRGNEIGIAYAECFEVVRRIIR